MNYNELTIEEKEQIIGVSGHVVNKKRSEAIKLGKARAKKNLERKTEKPVKIQKVENEYRTIFFPDCSIKIHRQSMNNLIIDAESNIHFVK